MINLKHISNNIDIPIINPIPSSSSSVSTKNKANEVINHSPEKDSKRIRPNAQFLSRYINQQEHMNGKLESSSSSSSTQTNDIDLTCKSCKSFNYINTKILKNIQ